MMLELGDWLRETAGWEVLRLFNYLSFRSIVAALTAFVVTLVLGRRVIVLLFQRGYRDVSEATLLADASSKRGTPTAGGVLILASTTVAFLFWARLDNLFGWMGFSALLYFGMVGFVDDYLKVRAGASRGGLSERAKWGAQLVYAGLFTWIYMSESMTPFPPDFAGKLFVPFYKHPIADIGGWYVFLTMFCILAITNAVNITDGLDGLAIVPCVTCAGVYAIFGYVIGNSIQSAYLQFQYIPGTEELTVLCSAVAGSGLGFLWFNAYPAEVFMGDTGSLALGGVLATVALLLKQEFLFGIVGAVFVVEVGSSLVQGKLGENIAGRRYMYRAPVHDTFKHLGIAEPRVVVRFWIVSVIMALLALLTIKLR